MNHHCSSPAPDCHLDLDGMIPAPGPTFQTQGAPGQATFRDLCAAAGIEMSGMDSNKHKDGNRNLPY